jgi:NADH-quinone oxidoreductase subunit C
MTEPVVPQQRRELHVVDVRTGSFHVTGSGDTSGFAGFTREVAMPGATSRPFGGEFDHIADVLFAALDERKIDGVEHVVIDRDEMTLVVRREHALELAGILRDHPDLRFEMCLGVSGVHFPGDAGRELHIIVNLLSITHNRRLRLEITAPDADPHVPSMVPLWPSADWHERETWDFFGIIFDGHPGLTRIMMPDDWPGHPQRKDYPLGGIDVEFKGASNAAPQTRRSYS